MTRRKRKIENLDVLKQVETIILIFQNSNLISNFARETLKQLGSKRVQGC